MSYQAGTLLAIPKVSECNANCRFCVSENLREFGAEIIEEKPFNLTKFMQVIRFAKGIGICDANITGGAEPTLGDDRLFTMTSELAMNFGRVTLYTNGGELLRKDERRWTLAANLASLGLSNMVISRVHHENKINTRIMRLPAYDLEETVATVIGENIDLKVSCLLNKAGISSDDDIVSYIEKMRSLGIRKIIFREMFKVVDDSPVGKWINANYIPVTLAQQLMQKLNIPCYEGLWNQTIYDYKGVGITFWPDGTRKDTINNGDLIYMPNNCLYSSWNYSSSRIM